MVRVKKATFDLFVTLFFEKRLSLYEAATQAFLGEPFPVKVAEEWLVSEAGMLVSEEYRVKRNVFNAGSKDWVRDQLVTIVENTNMVGDSTVYKPETAVRALQEVSKIEGHYAPVNVKIEAELEIVGYDFSAMSKPTIIEGEVIKTIASEQYLTAREEFANA